MSLLKGQRSIQTIILPLPPSLRPTYGNHFYRWLFAISAPFSGIGHPSQSITSPSSVWEIYEVAPQPVISSFSSQSHTQSQYQQAHQQPTFHYLPSADLTTQQLLNMQGTFIPLCVADENMRDVFLEKVDRYITFPPTDKGFNDQTFVLGVVEELRGEGYLGEGEYAAWVEAVGGFRG
ncbi:hypothetical protein GE21DRAFT_8422 [Neurospora crassa]|uniref:Uncharacterized protein n=1 Tax=Neurospora crassa (strain ATCC 24698 / 74-OR23-1A / CBS 708.71 / DSM 1257 / FGSC 987) TaxID=367110 RepID=Q7S1J9_NEUCR|nr:hypothetical protein NCU09956 [Neurospora crassa OR74A]EAA29227.1 hypothetical protein NCU09956 [Neurospora crassa OR74A]KHE79598.1 hypothetical protein GE21DRAFT_8422 [Neurospora crassa]|eukprot:XP_958463.1 hypothetical protein NCU09956 [Neurospora crassa OR74A]